VFDGVDESLRDMAEMRGRSKVLYEFQEGLEVEWVALRLIRLERSLSPNTKG
jgi:hypothetical protein